MIEKQEIFRGRKFHQVCKGARQIFLRDGYEGASVDDISRAAGVSKATLYSYFSHKRLMFEEVVRHEIAEIEKHSPALPETQPADIALPLRQRLAAMIEALSRDVVSEMQTGLYRLSIAEARRFPKLARDYHDRILQRRSLALAALLDHCAARGELQVADTRIAAEQLWRLTGASLAERAALLPPGSIRDEDIRAACAAALDLFLTAHATRPQPFTAVEAR